MGEFQIEHNYMRIAFPTSPPVITWKQFIAVLAGSPKLIWALCYLDKPIGVFNVRNAEIVLHCRMKGKHLSSSDFLGEPSQYDNAESQTFQSSQKTCRGKELWVRAASAPPPSHRPSLLPLEHPHLFCFLFNTIRFLVEFLFVIKFIFSFLFSLGIYCLSYLLC